mmetsp:Transcript_11847/g.14780  ORF Transcript_11847/g.14780 Transcript_11847/m.14780 type:complete len:251 (+) Transcript_11847:268-1020(+)
MSQTIVIPNMYQTPAQQYQLQTGNPPPMIDAAAIEEHLVDFYEDVCTELSNFGELEELHVCNNLGDHLMGNVYAKFYDEEGAAAAQQALHGRFYAKRALICEFSPVTDFREARCRQFDQRECTRGGYCNFMHLYKIPHDVERRLFGNRRRREPSPQRGRGRGSRDYYDAPYDRRSSSSSYRRRSRSRSPPPPRRDRDERYDRGYSHRSRDVSPGYVRRSRDRSPDHHERRRVSPERARYSRERERSLSPE